MPTPAMKLGLDVDVLKVDSRKLPSGAPLACSYVPFSSVKILEGVS